MVQVGLTTVKINKYCSIQSGIQATKRFEIPVIDQC